jgi:hypothetical protein
MMDNVLKISHKYRQISFDLSQIDDVCENRVMSRTYRTKSEEVTGRWRKWRNEELHDLYSSSNVIRVIKSGE